MLRPFALIFGLVWVTSAFGVTPVDTSNQIIISVKDQKLVLMQDGGKIATYPVSTSMFGVGDARGRMTTPLGYLAVEKKIGDNAPVGAVFHNRHMTGEILQPNAPGRDPITTRIIWLRGLEAQNAHAFQRCIYIHGTPEEKKLGRPASYGCIRMKANDVAALYDRVPVGTLVQITPDQLPKLAKSKVPRSETSNGVVAVTAPPQNQAQNPEPPPKLAKAKVPRSETNNSVVAATARPQNQTESPDRVPKVAKAPRVHSTNSVVAATALAAPPEHLSTPEPQVQDQSHTGGKHTADTPSVEDMRMAGGLAAQRQKAKLALGKRM